MGVMVSIYTRDHFHEKRPNAYFFKISIFFDITLHIASYALRIGVSLMDL